MVRIPPMTARASLILFISLEAILGWSALRDHWAKHGEWARVVRWNSHDAWALKNLADQQPNPCKEGLPLYARAVAKAPDQLDFREAYGHMLEACRQNDYLDDALTQYEAAYTLAPSRAIDALAIGRILFIHGNVAEALAWFENARHGEPHYWECDLWIARCYLRLGDKDKARWTLSNLPLARQRYLDARRKMLADLPSSDEPTGYSQTILAYNADVVTRELRALNR